MQFPSKYAGMWVASRDGEVVAASADLSGLLKRVDRQEDQVRFDEVPRVTFVGTAHGVSIHRL